MKGSRTLPCSDVPLTYCIATENMVVLLSVGGKTAESLTGKDIFFHLATLRIWGAGCPYMGQITHQ